MLQRYKKNRNECNPLRLFSLFHAPTQLAAPRAVTIAVAIDAIICTMNLIVSLFVIIFNFFTFLPFQLFTFKRWGFRPARLISLAWYVARWLGLTTT